ncbi:MAG: DNA adenine methylase [Treponema sp.]|jgi:DNA adenine methylase|nr:DNA adenine methylase [Treponema sp.]
MAKSNHPIKPYLKWAGGKRRLWPEIKKYLPKDIHNYTYYEPFIGAGAIFFALQPKKAVINDFNTQLILTYTVIKEQVEELIELLKEYKTRNNEAYYYEVRSFDRDAAQFNKLTDAEKAARLIFLNKTCFNGLYRVNSQGLFNVPYGRYKNPAICEETVLRQISTYLNANDITILNDDFECAAVYANADSFIYFDPPYHSQDNSNFTGYQADGFGEKEQERLRNLMIKMTNLGIKCLLSNSDTEYIRELYNDDGFDIISVQAARSINCNAAGRGNVNEVLIKNWETNEKEHGNNH